MSKKGWGKWVDLGAIPELLEQLPKKEEVTAAAKTPTPFTPWRKYAVFVGLVGLVVGALVIFLPLMSVQSNRERAQQAAATAEEKAAPTDVMTQPLLEMAAKREGEKARAKDRADNQRTQAASGALAYLNTEVPEVAWVEVEGNEAFIGFKERPSDLGAVVYAAAFHGNRAIGFGFHVWAVDATVAQKGWRPGDPGFICEATVRKGKVTDNSCLTR